MNEKINRNIIQANTKLVDENKLLKEDKEILQIRIKRAIKLIKETKEYFHDGIDIELIDILEGRHIENE